ncbi:MAG: hypothetical protein E2O79_09285 [Caldithrix sp.]|nr:MAG: hypothetical protein E2O79_09285 [Caldithrix sp.]
MNIFDPKNNLEWRDFLKILKRRIWYFIVPFLIVMPIGISKILLHVSLYEAVSIVQILRGSYRLLPSAIRQTLPGVSAESRSAKSIERQILSTEFTNKLIQRLDLYQSPEWMTKAQAAKSRFPDQTQDEIIKIMFGGKIKMRVKVSNPSAELFTITVKDRSPEFAFSLSKTITDIYINEAFERRMANVKNALEFNDEQLVIFKRKLEQAEDNLDKFRRNSVTSQVENPDFRSSSLREFQKAIVAIELAAREKDDYLNYLNGKLNLGENAESYPNTQSIRENLKRVDEKISQMASLMISFSWKSPEVISVNRKINDLREEIKTEIENLYRVKYQDVETQERALRLERSITIIDIELQKHKKEILNNTLQTSQTTSQPMVLKKLEREVASSRRIYSSFLQQNQGVLLEKTIAEADASSRFKILKPPQMPVEPINAGLNMILLVTLVSAVGTGLGGVLLREFLDSSVRTVNEAEEFFQLPVIGVVPYLGLQAGIPVKQKIILTVVGIVILSIGAYTAWYFKLHHIIEKI